VVLWYVGKSLIGQWRAYADAPMEVHFHWGFILASGTVVLLTYALLIDLWRRILAEWGATIHFSDAVRIWCVSNLGKYVPGKVWQILAMGRLAQRVDVPAAAAAGSAILNTVVNIAVGFVVAVVTGFRGLNDITHGNATLSIGFSIAAICGVLLLPIAIPRMTQLAERLTGRALSMGDLPARAVYLAIAGNTIAWLLYGFAFQLLVYGVLGRAPGPWTGYVAVYALSYVIGYLVFFTPGGVGTREIVQTTGLATLGLANPKEAAIIAVVSRLWLTVLEVLPGLYYLAREARLRSTPQPPRNGPNS
jgi:hypothetical protein